VHSITTRPVDPSREQIARSVPGATEVIAERCTGHDYSRPGKPVIAWDDEGRTGLGPARAEGLTGVVTSADGGGPLNAAVVVIDGPASAGIHADRWQLDTGPDGSYTASALAPGSYTIEVTPFGYVPGTTTANVSHPSRRRSTGKLYRHRARNGDRPAP
jgi:hypothetical protein